MPSRSRNKASSIRTYEKRATNPKQRHLASPSRIVKRVQTKTFETKPIFQKQDTLTQRGFDLHRQEEDADLSYSEDFEDVEKEVSSNKKRKAMTQTLTQGGFVFYKDLEETNLAYEEPIIPIEGASDRKKRRKLFQEPTTRQTRSARKRMIESQVMAEKDRQRNEKIDIKSEEENNALKQDISRVLMPPPRSPRSSSRKEVPSSQSSVDTPPPPNEQSARDQPRSPLEEKSMNARKEIRPLGKRLYKKIKLEIADSMESRYSDDGSALQPMSLSNPVPLKVEESVSNYSTSIDDSTAYASSHGPPARPQQSIETDIHRPVYSPQVVKTEVPDTDADDDDGDEETSTPIFETQDEPQSDMIERNQTTASSTHDEDQHPTPTTHLKTPMDFSETSSPIHSSPPKNRSKDGSSSGTTANLSSTLTISSSTRSSPQPPTTSPTPHHPSPSLPISHPPNILPPPLLDTESQFERSWHHHNTPVPPPPPTSQASTVDITQPSPSSPAFRPLDSSPPLPSLSFSLLHDGGDGRNGGGRGGDVENWGDGKGGDLETWDEIRLTDSQLLPDSILNDGLGMEGWGVEDLEDEEG